MTINEAITNIDAVEPNQYTQDQKIAWLNQLDGQIFDELVLTHEHDPETVFEPYTDTTATLLVTFPYDSEIYEYYLKAMITEANHETVKYNVAMSLFNAAYSRYCAWYNRNHHPIPKFPKNRLHF